MSDIAIKVENISKKYQIGENKSYPTLRDKLMELPNRLFKGPQKTKEFWALKDVSFEVKKGEVIGIIGRNGAGKSTMLKILARITEPTSGKITMYGRVASMLEVGTGFNPELTGRENIFLNGSIIGMTKKEIKQKLPEIIEFSGIEKFIDTPAKHYSSGMYMRLAFSIAAHLDSEILIVDEVLAVGDIEFQKKCLGKMDDIAKKDGRTVLFVSHNADAISVLCNRCILLNAGSVLYEGDVQKTLTKYNNIQNNVDLNKNNQKHTIHIGLNALRLTSVKMFNKDNVKSNIFKVNESLILQVSYAVYQKIVGLNLIISLFSNKNVGTLVTDVHYRVEKRVIKKGETGTVSIEIKLANIRQGEYHFSFWIGDETALNQNNPIIYDTSDNILPTLIIRDSSKKKYEGIFSLPSKIIRNQ